MFMDSFRRVHGVSGVLLKVFFHLFDLYNGFLFVRVGHGALVFRISHVLSQGASHAFVRYLSGYRHAVVLSFRLRSVVYVLPISYREVEDGGLRYGGSDGWGGRSQYCHRGYSPNCVSLFFVVFRWRGGRFLYVFVLSGGATGGSVKGS